LETIANPKTFEFTTRYNASVVVGLSVFTSAKKILILKTRLGIICAVSFYNAGVVTLGRRIGSRIDHLCGIRWIFFTSRDRLPCSTRSLGF
jgi:hypothetical protein